MDSGANNSGPDDTDNGGCERDWGFETHSRRTFTRLTHSEASESALGDSTRGRRRHITMDATTDNKLAGGDSLEEHFHFHTTRLKGFRSPETPHFGLPWNLPDRWRLPPEDEEWCWSGSFP